MNEDCLKDFMQPIDGKIDLFLKELPFKILMKKKFIIHL